MSQYTINCVGLFPNGQRVNPYGGDVFSTTYLPGRDDYPPPKGHWEVIDTYQSTRYPWEEDHRCHCKDTCKPQVSLVGL